MATYFELKAQRLELDRAIRIAYAEEVPKIIEEIRAKAEEYNLTEADLFGRQGKNKQEREKRPPKFKDPVSGKMWNGLGKPPSWFSRERETEFLIPGEQTA